MRGSFWIKAAAAAGLAVAADRLLFLHGWGWQLGVVAFGWVAAVAVCVPAVRRERAGRWCLAAAALLALGFVEAPGLLGWVLFWAALASAALLPRRRFGDAIGWSGRLLLHGVIGVARPLVDLGWLGRAQQRHGGAPIGAAARLMALPIAGGVVFATLFAAANPVIAGWLGELPLALPDALIPRLVFAAIVLATVWPTLRAGGFAASATLGGIEEGQPLVLPVATLIASLVVFNAVFAVENLLDLAFLWSGAALPPGVTLADYAHRGAYLLIVTALLAGAFVIVALHPGTSAAADRRVRWLVALWVGQNLLLVLSSMRRLADYVGAYDLTRWRVAAFAWMALVAVGLALTGWRMLAGRSARWLVNANAGAALAVLAAASVVDIGAIAARWNVDHAGRGNPVDLCYLRSLGSSALLPIVDLERRATGPALKAKLAALRFHAMTNTALAQDDWRGWTWRDARRLAAARAAVGPNPARGDGDFDPCRGAYGATGD